MGEAKRPLEEREDQETALRTYLRDHTAGAQHALALFKALQEVHAGTSLGDFAKDQFQEINEDLHVLEGIATDKGAENHRLKEAAGWLADKLSRLKLSPLADPFHTFEALEFLSLGILGKRALWRALMSVSAVHPELTRIDFIRLMERAELQHAATEEMRLAIAVRVFGANDVK